MTAKRWRNTDGHLIRVDGHHVRCDVCPCGCPEGSALYKIKYAEQDTSCTSGAANEYRLNISCECKCLITGTVPDPIPEGKTAADYYGYYPLSGGTSPLWKRTIAGGPFTNIDGGLTAAEQCDAFPVDVCVTGCGWYSLVTRVKRCPGDADYTCVDVCSARCLITGTVPDPIPEGKTAADYLGSYAGAGLIIGDTATTINGGPYTATCTQTAQQLALAACTPSCEGDVAYGKVYEDVYVRATPSSPWCYYGRNLYFDENGLCTIPAAYDYISEPFRHVYVGRYLLTYSNQIDCERKYWVIKVSVYTGHGGECPPAGTLDHIEYYPGGWGEQSNLHPLESDAFPVSDISEYGSSFYAEKYLGPYCTLAEAEANVPT